MNKTMKFSALALTAAGILTLTGCSSSSAQEKFTEITDSIFYDSVTADGLTLHMTLADPEAYGITEFPATLGSFSLEDMEENYKDTMETLEKVSKIDKEKLTEEQQIDYEILMAEREAEENGDEFLLYGYPLSSVNGLQSELPIIFAEYTFGSKEDVDNYLALLADTDEYYEQVLSFIQAQTEEGIYLSDVTIDGIIDSCQLYLDAPEDGLMAETFAARLDGLEGLTEEEKTSYIEKNREILEQDFTDAYVLLTEGLAKLKGHMEEPVGLASLPKGKDYYKYLLKSSIYTSYDRPRDLKNAIYDRLADDIMEMYSVLDTDPDIFDTMFDFQFSITDPREALEDLQVKILDDFPETPAYTYEVRNIPDALEEYTSPAFYLTPPIDRQDQNFIYVNPSLIADDSDLYTIMAHEGYPGHLYQCNYFNGVNDSKLRAVMSFTSYVEGWATYVEYLSYYWDENITDEMALALSANTSTSLAISALVDYQVNYEGMTMEELGEFLEDIFGTNDEETVHDIFQYVCENPSTYMKYYVGYLEIMEMREMAEEELGRDFDLKAFHTFLLDFGPAQFDVIRAHFSDWLLEQADAG